MLSESLQQLGEDRLVERLVKLLPPHTDLLTGPGDDCAVVRRDAQWDGLLKTDVVVENVHFLPDETPERIGWKALARAVSDIAAMGGIPEHALVTLLTDPRQPVDKLEGIYKGIVTCALKYGISIAGGETSSLPEKGLVINIALTGRVEKGTAILRSGAQVGDILCVTGQLGGSLGGHHLDFQPRTEEGRLLHAKGVSAMMDLSDGLAKDLPRLCKASGTGAACEENTLPRSEGATIRQALYDGEDYELLFTLSPALWESLRHEWPAELAPVSCIGKITEQTQNPAPLTGGWDHFSR